MSETATFLGNQVDTRVLFGVNVEGPDNIINFQISFETARGPVLRQLGALETVRLYAVRNNQRI